MPLCRGFADTPVLGSPAFPDGMPLPGNMIEAHGSERLNLRYVEEGACRNELIEEAEALPSLLLNSAAAANAVMLGAGYFSPLDGFMDIPDALLVAEKMRTAAGLFWPIPVLNLVSDAGLVDGARHIALRDPNRASHPVLAVQEVESIDRIDEEDFDFITERVYGTLDEEHPGVRTFRRLGRHLVAGPIEVLNYSYFEEDFPNTFRTAGSIRAEIDQRGWKRVVAFQTRNPMHRAHEVLCKMAVESTEADGVLIHMLLGRLKPGDIPAAVREEAIRCMVDLYFPPNSVMVAGYGFDMLYAGPREAVLHAIFRQNAGCTHLIVGRDHAGVGDFYGPFDAQKIFDKEVPAGALSIDLYRGDHTVWSRKLNRVVTMGAARNHSPDDFILLSGTRVREMLSHGIAPPPEFTRPEVAEILIDHYRKDG